MTQPSDSPPTELPRDSAPSGNDCVVSAKGLRKTYEELEAVRGIDFSVHRGEVFGFLGPNGAGKTTTMKMLYGFVKITSGELKILGLDVKTREREVKKHLGVVHQENNLDQDLSAREILIAHARLFGIGARIARPRADSLLDFFQLKEKADLIPRKLSGGMQRRLMMARALINEPEILILDEPTTGLDPQARHLLWHRLRELRRRGITILITSHYMDEVEALCDRLVLMNEGVIIAQGSPQELIKRYVGEEMIEIEAVEDEERRRMREMLTGEGEKRRVVEEFGDRLYVAVGEDDHPETRLRAEAGHLRWWRRSATLEDVFLRLAGRDLKE